jgi:CoA:oxalate CoA-transferase
VSILSGVRVLDFTHYISGPYCSQILADHGADVIKVERLDGEPTRIAGPFYNDVSLYFSVQNRNKRGLSLDLKSPEGQDIVQRLVKTANLLVTNYAAGVPDRIGIGFDAISAINPRISMVHITGFGSTGPYKDHAAFDGVIQAMSGLAGITGHPGGPPTNVGYYIADHLSGLQAAMGATMALFHRERTGKGRYVDISMLDGMISMIGYPLSEAVLLDVKHERNGTRDRYGLTQAYPTKDGYVFIAPGSAQMWENFCKIIGREEWGQSDSPFYSIEGRTENRDLLAEMISEWTVQHTKEEVFRLCQQLRIPCGPVNTLKDVANDPQVQHRNMVRSINMRESGDVLVPGIPIKVNDTPTTDFTRPPAIGEHSDAILEELGYSKEDIDRFRNNNTIRMG